LRQTGGRLVPKKATKHSTAFITAPIALLALAAVVVVIGSLIVGVRETDSIAMARQRATIKHALEQHGEALSRELKVQTVWSEAYDRTLAHDAEWMQSFYGTYLDRLLGYDRIYVLSSRNTPVYAYVDGKKENPEQFARIAPHLRGLISAIRDPAAWKDTYGVAQSPIDLGGGQSSEHRTLVDMLAIADTPSTAIVATIVPDRPTATRQDPNPLLLIAVQYLDASFMHELGKRFDFHDLRWTKTVPSNGTTTEVITSANGAPVGTLAWKSDMPGWQFARQVALGLILALLLLLALSALLMRWGRSKAQQLVESEEDARRAAQTDALTGLPNRVGLGHVLPKLIRQAKFKRTRLGILSIDIEHFREINDDFGHAVGDAVLLCAAKRLNGFLGTEAVLIRPGDDDFIILVPGIDPNTLATLADNIVRALAEPIPIEGGTHVYITASIGFAQAPRDGDCADDVVRRIGLALEKAKEMGGGKAVAFAPQMDLELTHRRMLESALRSAVAAGEIDVVYQPIMDHTGEHVVAAEALARWTDPVLGGISPEIFVPLAEETGLIPRIGELILRRAAADALAWPEIEISVNVSGAQIHHGDIVAVVREVLASSQLPPERLGIEVTESVLLADEKRADEQIKAVQDLGVRVALDDFGSGYSSLLYLRKFGFDKLKIDRSFVEEIGRSTDSMVILASIIRLGLDLRMTITAEGVETEQQLAWLKASGCHQLQGYLFSAPLPAQAMSQFLAAHRPVAATG
jgi:diguanylate cyclase (GGDEF)-like protein